MKKNSKKIIGLILAVMVLGVVVWFARPSSINTQQANLNSGASGAFVAEESEFDFGAISMAAGKVKHEFKIKNTGSGPVTVEKMYTSCMCTSASVTINGARFGPYGMPGHGFIPRLNKEISAGEEVSVEVVFDPAAHGPAGVGPIQRAVAIETSSGTTELGIRALVQP